MSFVLLERKVRTHIVRVEDVMLAIMYVKGTSQQCLVTSPRARRQSLFADVRVTKDWYACEHARQERQHFNHYYADSYNLLL